MSYSAGEYPLPTFAAYIWLAGDTLMLGLPPSEGNSRGHQVAIPAANLCTSRELTDRERSDGVLSLDRSVKTRGFIALLDVLRERAREGRVPKLGTRGEPTQYNLEEVLHKVKKYAPNGREAPTSLADLGLD